MKDNIIFDFVDNTYWIDIVESSEEASVYTREVEVIWRDEIICSEYDNFTTWLKNNEVYEEWQHEISWELLRTENLDLIW